MVARLTLLEIFEIIQGRKPSSVCRMRPARANVMYTGRFFDF